jgi:hypothetical protein
MKKVKIKDWKSLVNEFGKDRLKHIIDNETLTINAKNILMSNVMLIKE